MSRPYACETATCGRISAHDFGDRGCTSKTPDDVIITKANIRARIGQPDENGCWPWLGAINVHGYGNFHAYDGKSLRAHRVVYELMVGPIPDGLVIDHLCRVRHCVNPSHMEPVPPEVNVLRGVGPTAINRLKSECVRGHEFTPENTADTGRGGRRCKTCSRDGARARNAAKPRLLPAGDERHGTTRGYSACCRCDECRAAWAAYRRAGYGRAKATAA